MPENTIHLTAGDNTTFEGVAIGDRNKIISHVQAQGHVIQADHSQVHIGDIYYYFEIPKSDVIKKEPYKFLSTYTLADENIFFGRKQAIADLSSQILDHKLVIINGKSGSGKSSLMHAGVTPKLLRNNHLVIHITDYLTTPVPTIQEAIQGGLESPVVIFLDQFERFFIYLPVPEQQRFTAAFKDWLVDDTTNVRFVIAIRMDFFGRLGEFQPVIPNFYQQNAIFTLLPLNRDEAREAIEGPLEALNIRIVYEPALLDTLLDSLLEDAEIEPAQLQIVCDELYRRALANNAKIINAALYEAAGGVKGMLENYLQRKLAEYTPNDDEVKAILKQMIAPVEISAGIRSFVAVAQITERIKLPQPDIERLITRLVDDRLIEKKSGEDTYSIAHEYLAGQVQQWFDPRETAIRRARDILDHAVRYETLMPYQEAAQVKQYASDLELNDTEHALLQRSLRKHTLGVWLRWGIVTVIALFAVIAASLGFYANLQRNDALFQKDRAEKSQITAETKEKEANRRAMLSLAQTMSFEALDQLARHNGPLSVLLARQAYLFHQQNQGTLLAQMDNALRRVLDVFYVQSKTLKFNQPDLWTSAAFSPDGTHLAFINADNTVWLWDLAQLAQSDATPLILAGHEDQVNSVVFSSDGTHLASGSKDRTVRVWDLTRSDAEPLILNGHKKEVSVVAFSPDGKLLASGGRDKTVRVWDVSMALNSGLTPPVAEPRIFIDDDIVTSVAFSPDGKLLASSGRAMTVQVRDLTLPDPAPLKLSGHTNTVIALTFSPDSKLLASGGADKTIRVWDISTALVLSNADRIKPVATTVTSNVLVGHDDVVDTLAFSRDGMRLASGGRDKTVRLWDLSQPAAVPRILAGHEGYVRAVAFSPDSMRLFSSSNDQTVRVWDLTQPTTMLRTLAGHARGVLSVAYSRDGTHLASGGYDNMVRVRDAATGNEIRQLTGHTDVVWSVAFSPDGKLLASGSKDTTVRVWNLAQPDVAPRILNWHMDPVFSVVFSPDGKLLASGSQDKTMRVWDLTQPDANQLKLVKSHPDTVFSVAFSSDSKFLASGSADRIVRVWDLTQPEAEPLKLSGHTDVVKSVAFSPDNHFLASGGPDKTVRLWDLTHPTAAPYIFIGHESPVVSVAFSRDDKFLASGSGSFSTMSADPTVRVWDLTQPATAPRVLAGHEYIVTSVAFNPDGTRLASGSADGTIRIWNVQVEELAGLICEQVERNLTWDEWQQFVGPDIPYKRTCPDLPEPPDLPKSK